MEGEQPYLGDLPTVVINHLLTGMILQVGIIETPDKAKKYLVYKEYILPMGWLYVTKPTPFTSRSFKTPLIDTYFFP